MATKLASIDICRDIDEYGNFEDKNFSEFDQLIDDNENLRNVYCIGIHTGYTDRLMNKKKRKELGYAVCFTDICWSRGARPVIVDREIYETVRKVSNEGTVVFKDNAASNVFNYVDMLNDADYCGCCNTDNIYQVDWYEVDGKTVMICYVDCESG